MAALEAGERPLDWKPNVCWQVPIRLEHSTDENGHVTSRLRDWKRRDWGKGGEDFHWWCTETPDAYVGDEPVYRSARDEIIELVGAPIYDLLVEALEHAPGAGTPDTGDVPTALRLRIPLGPCAGDLFVVAVDVLVELDAVLLGQRRVLVLLGRTIVVVRRGSSPPTITESEVERPRS